MAKDLDMSDPRIQDAVKDLTGKQTAFAVAIATNPRLSATQAARDSEYKGDDNVLAQVGFENMRKPNIVKAVTIIKGILHNDYKLTIDKVLIDLEDAISQANTKGDVASRIRGIELQGKYLAMWTDKQQIEDPAKVRQLEEKEADEARRIAQIRLRDCG